MAYCGKCGEKISDGAKFCCHCGETAVDDGETSIAQEQEPLAYPSKFTGGAFANAFVNWLVNFVSVITLFLARPAMICYKYRWEYSHTYINGRQLCFDGKGGQLFGKYMLWTLLSVVTLGIYYVLCMSVALEKWKTSHTHFADAVRAEDGENASRFDGTAFGLLGVKLLTGLVTVITFGFGMYWAHCYKERWFCKHRTVDGVRFVFDGRAAQYFGKCVQWSLLTLITLGIYSFWLFVKAKKWTVSHTVFDEQSVLPDFMNAPHGGAVSVNKNKSVREKRTNGFSIAGFVLALTICATPIGLVFSIIGLVKSKTYKKGKGLAIVGIVICGCIILFFVVCIAIMIPKWMGWDYVDGAEMILYSLIA